MTLQYYYENSFDFVGPRGAQAAWAEPGLQA